MADNINQTEVQDDIQEKVQDKAELQKAFDESLNEISDLLKSNDSVDELLEKASKDPAYKEKIKKAMSKMDKEEGDEEEEEEEEEKVKKSIDETLDNVSEEFYDVIDAVPVLKSLTKIVKNMAGEILELKKSIDDNAVITKSLAKIATNEALMLKSINDEIEKIGDQPLPVKGQISREQILNKSFGAEQPEKPTYNRDLVKNILLKSVELGEIESKEIGRWELGGYRMETLSPIALGILKSKLEGGK
jgi:hypothetical protein